MATDFSTGVETEQIAYLDKYGDPIMILSGRDSSASCNANANNKPRRTVVEFERNGLSER